MLTPVGTVKLLVPLEYDWVTTPSTAIEIVAVSLVQTPSSNCTLKQ